MSKNINSTIFTPVLIGGSLILLISFAIRSTFGLFQIPIAEQFMWARSEFSMAIAIQNLAWGIGTPIFSAFAEKFGDRKAITIGLILYALGIFIKWVNYNNLYFNYFNNYFNDYWLCRCCSIFSKK